MNGKNIESGRMAVAVLVGGRSIRMGLPKESVVIPDDGRTFLERICDEVDIISDRLFIARYLSVREGQCIERDGYATMMPDANMLIEEGDILWLIGTNANLSKIASQSVGEFGKHEGEDEAV